MAIKSSRSYASLLLAGGALASFGTLDSAMRLGDEVFALSLVRGGTCGALLLFSLLHWRCSSRRAPLFTVVATYGIAYLLIAISYRAWLSGMAKGFAPADPAQASWMYGIGSLWLIAIVLAPLAVVRKTTSEANVPSSS